LPKKDAAMNVNQKGGIGLNPANQSNEGRSEISEVQIEIATYPYTITNNSKKETYQGDELSLFRPVFDKLLTDIRNNVGKKGIVIADQLSARHTILGTSWRNENFSIVLRELLMNAMRAVEGKKDRKVRVVAAIQDNQLILNVIDNGDGLAGVDKKKIFKMGVTTKNNQIPGTVGKGLAYNALFLKQTWPGSTIEAFDNKEDLHLPQAGSTFRITIPNIDRAMVGTVPNLNKKGGIDLNPANQNLVIQGNGNKFAFPDQLKDLDAAQISGFVPIVVSIKPISDLSKILGIDGV